jgi:hypothetical protein
MVVAFTFQDRIMPVDEKSSQVKSAVLCEIRSNDSTEEFHAAKATNGAGRKP